MATSNYYKDMGDDKIGIFSDEGAFKHYVAKSKIEGDHTEYFKKIGISPLPDWKQSSVPVKSEPNEQKPDYYKAAQDKIKETSAHPESVLDSVKRNIHEFIFGKSGAESVTTSIPDKPKTLNPEKEYEGIIEKKNQKKEIK